MYTLISLFWLGLVLCVAMFVFGLILNIGIMVISVVIAGVASFFRWMFDLDG